jgi:hypothetical protein
VSDLPKLSDVLARVLKPETEGPFMDEATVPHFVKFSGQYGIINDPKARFIAFSVDNGPTDLEVRIPHEFLPYLQGVIDKAMGRPTTAVREVGR